jgi:hypothetical protein
VRPGDYGTLAQALGAHPTVLGHQQIGDWVAWHLANGLDNGKPLHLDPTGSFYTV